MANNIGDFDTSAVIYGKFVSCRADTGAPATLTSGALSVYKDNSTTQSTTGVTFTGDFDSVTGFNHFAIDTSADGSFYSAGSFFDVVVTTGTVNSVSAVGSCVGQFTIRKTAALKPTTAGRTLVVDSSGLADANAVKLGPSGSGTAQTARDIGAGVLVASGGILRASYAADTGHASIRSNTAQAGSGTTITLDASASASNSFYNNCIVYITGGTGVGQARFISAYVGSTKVATVATWITNPDNTSTFAILPFDAVAGASAPTAAQVATAVWQDTTSGDFTTSGSIGKSLFTSGAVPGAAGGLFIAGTNAATAITTSLTTTFTGNLTGTLSSTERNAIADAALDRDMSTGTDSGSTTVRTMRQALRFLRNKWSVSTGTLTVCKEDDSTTSWTSAVTTDAAAVPIIANDPAGP